MDIQQTISGSLTRAIWELNTQQALIIADGLLAIPSIEGIIVRDDSGAVITQLGQYIDISEKYSNQLVKEGVQLTEQQSGLFGYTFPLIFEFSGRATQVGDVTLFSSSSIVLDRIKVGIYFLIGNASSHNHGCSPDGASRVIFSILLIVSLYSALGLGFTITSRSSPSATVSPLS